jgi:hypothetical protein
MPITLTGGNIQNSASVSVPNGTLSLQLNVDATIVAAPYGFIGANETIFGYFDANGNLEPLKIYANTELYPQIQIGIAVPGSPGSPTIIQVNFDPTKWANGTGVGTSFGSNGFDAISIYLDRDGLTAWAFEGSLGTGSGAGFARFNLSDGSIIHQDATFGNPGSSIPFLYTRQDGTVFWQQDDAGFYYTLLDNGSGTFSFCKFHIAPGPAGNLLNGYCVVDAMYTTTNGGFTQDICVWTNGGVHYLAWTQAHTGGGDSVSAINADTMAFIGSYAPSPGNRGWRVFADGSHVLWAVFGDANADSTRLVRWDPVDGATGTILNVTSSTITDATLGTAGDVNFGTYVAANNSVLLANSGNQPYTNDLIGISLSTFARTALSAGSQTLSYDWEYDALQSAMDTGVQPNGSFAIPGDILVSGSPSPTQLGGIINIIDPVTLAVKSSINITAVINASAVLTPIPTENIGGRGSSCTPPFENIQFAASGIAVVTYDYGSPVYIYKPAVPTPPIPQVEPKTFYWATVYDANGARLTKARRWQFTEPAGSIVDIALQPIFSGNGCIG